MKGSSILTGIAWLLYAPSWFSPFLNSSGQAFLISLPPNERASRATRATTE